MNLKVGDLSKWLEDTLLVISIQYVVLVLLPALQLFRNGGLLGTTLLPNLALDIGNNSLKAVGNFQVWMFLTKIA